MVNIKKLEACLDKGHIPQSNTLTVSLSGKEYVKCSRCKQAFNLTEEVKRKKELAKKHAQYGGTFDQIFDNHVLFPPLFCLAFVLFFTPVLSFAATSIIDSSNTASIQRDGDGSETGTNWLTQFVGWTGSPSGGGFVNNNDTGFLLVYTGSYPAEFAIGRGFMKFPVESDIPDGATINSVDLCLTVENKSDNYSGTNDFKLFSAAPASDTLAVTDFDDVGSTALSDDVIDVAAISANDEICFTLNSAGLTYVDDFSAVTWFSVRSYHDYTPTSPGLTNTNYAVNAYGNADTDNPYLLVDYTEGASSSSAASSSSSAIFIPDGDADCIFGSGCNLGSSGSLIITTGACDSFADVLDGSGNTIGTECSEWSTAIKIPAVKFFVDSFNAGIVYGVVALIVMFLIMRWILAVIGWLWRLFTFS